MQHPPSVTGLYWSNQGEVACDEHTPAVDDPRWTLEGWNPVPVSSVTCTALIIRCQSCAVDGRAIIRIGHRHSAPSRLAPATPAPQRSTVVRSANAEPTKGPLQPHRCSRCRHELHLVRQHVSPPRLGAPLTTHFYQCSACDSAFALNVATGRWKPWVGQGS